MWLRRSRAGKVRSRLPVCRWIDAGFCASAHTQDVRSGSWLCENAKTLNRDRRSYSSRTVLVAQRASGFNLEIELKNIILCRVSVFEFLHSQGQKLTSRPRNPTSALHPKADSSRTSRHVRDVPIVLQKSQNALRLIFRGKTKQATIADRCARKPVTEVSCELVTG